MIKFINDFKDIDKSILKLMKTGFKFSFILCLIFTYILYFYAISPSSHTVFNIGYLGVKCSLMFFVSFAIGAFASDKFKKGII